MEDATAVALTSVLLLGGAQLMDQLGPGLDTVRTAARSDRKVRAQLNAGELWAGIVVMGAGVALSIMAERPEPAIMAAVVVGGSFVAYEMAWRADPGAAGEPLG